MYRARVITVLTHGMQNARRLVIHWPDHYHWSICDFALSLVLLALLSSVILALVADQAVSRLVTPAALIAGQRLRHVEVRVSQVSLQGPSARKGLLTESTVSTIRVFMILFVVRSQGVLMFRGSVSRSQPSRFRKRRDVVI